jgi:hypothetical protein
VRYGGGFIGRSSSRIDAKILASVREFAGPTVTY